MSADRWPSGYDRIVLDEVDSTNAHAARIAGDLTRPTWIMARRQTVAHGRRGRPWIGSEGDFAATLAMRPGEELAGHAALRSFVAALALYDVVVELFRTAHRRGGKTGGAPALSLKWPNDVLLNGGKLAGILLESESSSDSGGRSLRYLAIGIGVNLVTAPAADAVAPEALRPVSLQGETGLTVEPKAFLGLLAQSFDAWEDQFTSFGFAPVRNAWLSRAARLGEPITARTGRASHQGRFETLDDDGALVLDTAEGRVTLPAADVYF